MHYIQRIILILLLAGSAQLVNAQTFGTDRAGTAGFQFTKIQVDPRSAAMGNSNMADAFDGSSLFWNPALAARLEGSTVMLSHTSYVAGISLDYFSITQKIGKFAVGGYMQYLNSGEIKETTEFQWYGTGRTFRTLHLATGISASQQVTELFSYGITFKYLLEKIEEINVQSGAVDFGFSYFVGETGLRFAVGVNNFSPVDVRPSGTTTKKDLDGEKEVAADQTVSLPTIFHIGAAYDVLETEISSLVVTAQITNPSDNAEQFNMGAEYGFMEQFYFRSGYEFGNKERKIPSFGGGIKFPFKNKMLKADYAYTVYERLGGIHRIAVSFAL